MPQLFTQKFVLLDRRKFSVYAAVTDPEAQHEIVDSIKEEFVFRSLVIGDAEPKDLFKDAMAYLWNSLGSEAEFFYVITLDAPEGVEGGTRPEDL